MKLIALFGMASLAAFGAGEKHADHDATGTASCCAAPQGEARFSYLEVANPIADGKPSGTVTGKVMFDGKAPKTEPLSIAEDAAKGCTDEGKKVDRTDRSLVLHKDGGIASVVVTIKVKGAEGKVPTEAIAVDQMACRYEPHVVLIPTGSTVKYLNSDKVSHNVHTYAGKNASLNKTIAPGSSEDQKLDKNDKIVVKCDIHPWMNAHMFVTDEPYSTVTDADGAFSVEGIPAGEHKVEIWHEKLGKGKAKIIVNEDGTSEMLEIKLGGAKKKKKRR